MANFMSSLLDDDEPATYAERLARLAAANPAGMAVGDVWMPPAPPLPPASVPAPSAEAMPVGGWMPPGPPPPAPSVPAPEYSRQILGEQERTARGFAAGGEAGRGDSGDGDLDVARIISTMTDGLANALQARNATWAATRGQQYQPNFVTPGAGYDLAKQRREAAQQREQDASMRREELHMRREKAAYQRELMDPDSPASRRAAEIIESMPGVPKGKFVGKMSAYEIEKYGRDYVSLISAAEMKNAQLEQRRMEMESAAALRDPGSALSVGLRDQLSSLGIPAEMLPKTAEQYKELEPFYLQLTSGNTAEQRMARAQIMAAAKKEGAIDTSVDTRPLLPQEPEGPLPSNPVERLELQAESTQKQLDRLTEIQMSAAGSDASENTRINSMKSTLEARKKDLIGEKKRIMSARKQLGQKLRTAFDMKSAMNVAMKEFNKLVEADPSLLEDEGIFDRMFESGERAWQTVLDKFGQSDPKWKPFLKAMLRVTDTEQRLASGAAAPDSEVGRFQDMTESNMFSRPADFLVYADRFYELFGLTVKDAIGAYGQDVWDSMQVDGKNPAGEVPARYAKDFSFFYAPEQEQDAAREGTSGPERQPPPLPGPQGATRGTAPSRQGDPQGVAPAQQFTTPDASVTAFPDFDRLPPGTPTNVPNPQERIVKGTPTKRLPKVSDVPPPSEADAIIPQGATRLRVTVEPDGAPAQTYELSAADARALADRALRNGARVDVVVVQ